MKILTEKTHSVRIYLSGPIEVAKQLLRAECLRTGLCITIEPSTFIYTGGEERGYVVGLVNYPRFPTTPCELNARALHIAEMLLTGTHQLSALVMTPTETTWLSRRTERPE